MKKLLMGLMIVSGALSSNVYAKNVAFCSNVMFIGANTKMTCSGDIKGKYTPRQLYHKGWTIKTDISRADSFILVFEK